jgi:hypothetical protein
MKLTHYGGVPFASMGLTNVETQRGSLGMELEVEYLRRAGAEPAHVETTMTEHEFVVMVDLAGGTRGAPTRTKPQVDAVRDRLAGLVFGGAELMVERDMVGIWHDGTVVSRPCRPKSVVREQPPYLKITFASSTPWWRTVRHRVVNQPLVGANNEGIVLDLKGSAPVSPRIVVIPNAQRATTDAVIGYKYRMAGSIVNNTGQPVVRHPYRLDLGNTASKVTNSKMRADGHDVALVINGKEQQRQLSAFNTTASYLWFVIDYIEPGDSLYFDLYYGNPTKTSSKGLFYPNKPVFDLDSSSNGTWKWPIDLTTFTSGNDGLFYINSKQNVAPTFVDYTVPGSWRPDVTLDYESRDQLWFRPWLSFSLSGQTYYNAKPSFNRFREGSTYGDVGGPDGVVLSSPVTIQQLVRQVRYVIDQQKGVVASVAKYVELYRLSTGESWTMGHNTGTDSFPAGHTEPLTTSTFPAGTKHIAVAMWPQNEANIGSIEDPLTDGFFTPQTRWEVNFDWVTLPHGFATEEPVYEHALRIRQGTGKHSGLGGYKEMLIGGDADHRLALPLDWAVEIDCDEHTIRAVDIDNGDEVLGYLPPAVVQSRLVVPYVNRANFTDGEDEIQSRVFAGQRWVSVPYRENPLPNPRFAGGITDWDSINSGNGTISYDAAQTYPDGDGTGALRGVWTASSGFTILLRRSATFVPIGPIGDDTHLAIAAWFRVTNLNILPLLGFYTYDSVFAQINGALVGQPALTQANAWQSRETTSQRLLEPFKLTPDAAYVKYAVGFTASGGAQLAGTGWIDCVLPGGSDLDISDQLTGQNLDCWVSFRDGFLL